ncbi:hypothetical protein PsyrH_19830 [Pseudomonas syringae pv. syringae HS191]|uniref:hypothetical protein n=1 Tax=Pseudomonas syringae TaxID=317 RepID=UPI000624C491|nr:hypothetical protein [Pseudomonas syringae]AKF52701.1 hypothetical protein PsyrH_19830 [Pseudomonas syringae pv. syringae HS191]KTC13108.1 hypothetical protein AO390_25860 [Pseudomonas marginalis ICMP 11289]RML68588.1 hypothetical protein ALQ91_01482 [Pseudomonas syringae pv. syringae]
MMDVLTFVGFVVLASTCAIGMWALGRWLRSKGYGAQLDRLDRQYTALQLRVSPFALSASYRMFAGARTMNRLPLLGSKSSAALNQQMLVTIQAVQEAQEREIRGNR